MAEQAIERPNWDEYFMLMAMVAALRSNCLKRRVGALIVSGETRQVISTGYNGAARGAETCLEKGHCYYEGLALVHIQQNGGDPEAMKELYKPFCNVVHAERNCLDHCAGSSASARGGIMYVTTFPCPKCSEGIVQAGVRTLVFLNDYLEDPLYTEDERRAAERILGDGGVNMRKLRMKEKRLPEMLTLMTSVGVRLPYKFDPSQMQ